MNKFGCQHFNQKLTKYGIAVIFNNTIKIMPVDFLMVLPMMQVFNKDFVPFTYIDVKCIYTHGFKPLFNK